MWNLNTIPSRDPILFISSWDCKINENANLRKPDDSSLMQREKIFFLFGRFPFYLAFRGEGGGGGGGMEQVN